MKFFVGVLLASVALGGWMVDHATAVTWVADEVLDVVSSSSATSSLPPSSCDASIGLVCIPTACNKTSCTLLKTAKCVADRCGCEARFFKWNAKSSNYQDFTTLCKAGNRFVKAEGFRNVSKDSNTNDENNDDSSSSTMHMVTPVTLVELYRSFNQLLIQLALDLGRYLQDIVRSDPSQQNIDKLRLVLDNIRALRNSTSTKMSSSTSADEESSDENPEPKINWKKVISTGVNVAKQFLDENGPFADEIASGNVALSDEGVQDALKMEARVCGKVCVRGICVHRNC